MRRAAERAGRRPGRVIRVLAVSDEVEEGLLANVSQVRSAELIVACGDLPAEYLGALMNALDVPLVFVPGNHDPDQSGYRVSRTGLITRAGWRRLRDRRGADILLTHAPPRGVGDGGDPAHRGFGCYHALAAALGAPVLLHGHVHPYGAVPLPLRLGRTTVRNVTGWHLFELGSGRAPAEIIPDPRHAR